ncbi:MAG: hypothetical protein KA974_11925, partial [Saprospiraceae bacterium]|nr:hypothetical protein [Saprospiraceae bacterium]
IAESNASMAEDKYKTELNKWQSLYQSNLALLNTYKATTLQNAAVIKQTANQQFSKGEINYLDYVMLIHQAISIDNNYVDARQALNNAMIQLNFITIQN